MSTKHKHGVTLQTIMCRSTCHDNVDCRIYQTPMHHCYNGEHLFPGDSSWANVDILDVIAVDYDTNFGDDVDEDMNKMGRISMAGKLRSSAPDTPNNKDQQHPKKSHPHRFWRYLFAGSQNSTCTSPVTDAFELPTETCVGPFGPPRPWGNFTFLYHRDNYQDTIRTEKESEFGRVQTITKLAT